MIRNKLWFALGALLGIVIAQPVAAQDEIIPPEILQEMQKIREDALRSLRSINMAHPRPAVRQPQRAPVAADGLARWGGVRFDKASAKLQEQFGLGDKEGMVVIGFDPNSIGEAAGLKVNDVLVKINNRAVPNDVTGFALLVKDQKAEEPFDLVVVREGKEQTIKGARMPAVVQNMNAGRGPAGLGGLGGMAFGGGLQLQMFPGAGAMNPFMPLQGNQGLQALPAGVKIVKTMNGDQFSGQYSKDDLSVSVSGKLDFGQPKVTEITIQQGKESKKYTDVGDVPAKYVAVIRQLLPGQNNGMLFPEFPALPGFPAFPGLELQ